MEPAFHFKHPCRRKERKLSADPSPKSDGEKQFLEAQLEAAQNKASGVPQHKHLQQRPKKPFCKLGRVVGAHVPLPSCQVTWQKRHCLWVSFLGNNGALRQQQTVILKYLSWVAVERKKTGHNHGTLLAYRKVLAIRQAQGER